MIFSQLLSIATDWQDKVWAAVDNLLPAILIIACSVGMIWAIVVGIKMMKADEKSKREEAKSNLIHIAISIVAIAVLIGLFYALREWLGGEDGKTTKDPNEFGDIFDKQTTIGNTLSLVKQCVSMLVFKC